MSLSLMTNIWSDRSTYKMAFYTGYYSDRYYNYIVARQLGGVSVEPPWLRAATRHGPVTLYSVNPTLTMKGVKLSACDTHKTYIKPN